MSCNFLICAYHSDFVWFAIQPSIHNVKQGNFDGLNFVLFVNVECYRKTAAEYSKCLEIKNVHWKRFLRTLSRRYIISLSKQSHLVTWITIFTRVMESAIKMFLQYQYAIPRYLLFLMEFSCNDIGVYIAYTLYISFEF